MKLQSKLDGGVQIIKVDAARIDAAAAIQFKDAIRAITDKDAQRVVLDLQCVNFVDSSGLGAIVAAKKQLGEQTPLELAGLMPNVKKVFRLTRMDTVFTLRSGVDHADERHDAG